MYLLKYNYSEDEMMEALNISRSTLYREKKRALSLLGVILWGYMLPGIMRSIPIRKAERFLQVLQQQYVPDDKAKSPEAYEIVPHYTMILRLHNKLWQI